MACPSCITGVVHEGVPQGREELIFGLPCYITSPSIVQANRDSSTSQQDQSSNDIPTSGHLVILPDALGYKLRNTRLLADRYAQRCNANIYIPEFMDDYGMDPALFQCMDIVLGHVPAAGIFAKLKAIIRLICGFLPFFWFNRQAVCEPQIKTWMAHFRDHLDQEYQKSGHDSKNVPKIGMAGFCWGGKYTFLLSHISNSPLLVDFAYTAHPSNLTLPYDATNVAVPLCVVVGEKDPLLPPTQVEMIKSAFDQKNSKGSRDYQLHVFAVAGHGFAVRARLGDDEAVRQGKDAEDIAVEWFNKYLKGDGRL